MFDNISPVMRFPNENISQNNNLINKINVYSDSFKLFYALFKKHKKLFILHQVLRWRSTRFKKLKKKKRGSVIKT